MQDPETGTKDGTSQQKRGKQQAGEFHGSQGSGLEVHSGRHKDGYHAQ